MPSGGVVGGFEDNSVRVWTNLDSKPKMLLNHTDSVQSVNFLDNNQIVSGACDNTIIIWSQDMSGPSQILDRGHNDCITGLVFLKSSNVSFLISGSKDAKLIVWKNQGNYGSNLNISMQGAVLTMAYRYYENKNIIASGLSNSFISIWYFDHEASDLYGFDRSLALNGHSEKVLSLTFTFSSLLNKTVLASGSADKNSNILLIFLLF